jgi:hypothetical protein
VGRSSLLSRARARRCRARSRRYELGPQHRAAARAEWPPHSAAARTRDRRVGIGERHGLPPRATGGLRRLGRPGQSRVELERRAALFPAFRGQRRSSRLAAARHGRADPRDAHGEGQSDECGFPRGIRGAGQFSGLRGLHGRSPGGLRPATGNDSRRPAGLHRARLPAPGPKPSQPAGHHAGAGQAGDDRARPCGGRRDPRGQR